MLRGQSRRSLLLTHERDRSRAIYLLSPNNVAVHVNRANRLARELRSPFADVDGTVKAFNCIRLGAPRTRNALEFIENRKRYRSAAGVPFKFLRRRESGRAERLSPAHVSQIIAAL